jgi:ABC-type lipoprotein release transport system permease subunit
MKLLLINAFKGLKKKKIQMFAIIMMIALSTGIYVAMNTALDRLEEKYYSYLEEQNVENVSFDVSVDYAKEVSIEDMEEMRKNYLSEITKEENTILSNYENLLKNKVEIEDQDFLSMVQFILTKYEANTYLESKKLASIQDKYEFDFELERSKTVTDDDFIMKVIPYNKEKIINKVYLKEGHLPENSKEITMLEGFAKAKNLNIGDTFKIGEEDYTIVGFTYASDYIYPLITFSTPIFDEEENNIIFTTTEDYENIKGIVDNTYAIKFRGDVKRKFEFETETSGDSTTITLKNDPITYLLENEPNTVYASVNTVTRIARIGALQLEFATNRLFADYFLYLLLAIAVIIIIIITKKRIEDERLQIGVLKSLGYSKYSIALSYLVYPILGSIIGGILGFTIGSLLNGKLANLFLGFYNVPLDHFSINIHYLGKSIVTPLLVLSILSYLIALIMLRKKPLSLLKEGSNLKVNLFSKLMNLLTKFLPFKQRFKYSLASRSLGKLLIVSITSFGAGMLIVLTLIGMNLFNTAIDQTFEGMNYDYLVYMNNYYDGETTEKDDQVLSVSTDLKEIVNKKIEKDDTAISLVGIDQDIQSVKILNEAKEDIKNLLTEKNNIIISKNMQEYFDLEINDELVLEMNNQKYTYKIVGISNEIMNFNVYIDRENLSKDLGFSKKVYNVIYSSDSKYKNMNELEEDTVNKITYVMSFQDLKDNIMKQMDRYNTSIYIIILFASVMAFIIISVIASIIVEENKKTISLMKVMGYKNKEVSSIVLNIYTPFVIIAYLLSIPAMKSILNKIVSSLVADTEMTIPITLSFKTAMIGLLGLLLAYYIAISISKRVLKKVPLAVALKRE